ncbi:TetR/AcrR family transcriptional regulator [Cryptosporangium aurantiacum]|uniref:Transcriptional regulator, TetR family n=1 Tax=Cryptosporangium aurantiacum TaxID=134849 RepID=A0A1M7RKI7_9ACTN|nr:TetR/AcrR family transcriptional regulator [Cryptosporangium aurantiacum]SHN46588.1 transcriptional regulator, TetR family [Cryptosporangium aurantiacum]
MTSPRELRRQQRVATSREQILDTAEELFGSQGYRATSLQRVAERCEFSVGALYQFFSGKEELLQAVMYRRGNDLFAAMRGAISPDETGVANLVAVVEAISAFFERFPSYGQLTIRLASPGEDAPKDLSPAGEGFAGALALFADVLRSGQRSGDVRPGDPAALAELASNMMTAYLRDRGSEGLTSGEFREILSRAFSAVG